MAGSLVCLSARLENGQLQEDGEKRGHGMGYPPWGLVSCWGRKLLRVKVPPPDTGVWGGGGHGKRGKKLDSPGASWWAGSSLALSGGSSSLGWGWERRCLCVRSYSSLEAWQRSEGFTRVGGEPWGRTGAQWSL